MSNITFTRHYPYGRATDGGSDFFLSVANRRDRSIPGCKMLEEKDERYHGLFPSKDVCEFVNSCKDKMQYFDDNMRMAYGKPDHVAFIPYTLEEVA